MTGKGFTLIELLVVVAIIGILAAVVLASLNITRAKARDARLQVELRSIQVQAALFYEENDTFDVNPGVGVCETPATIASLQHVYPGYDPNNTNAQNGVNCNDDDTYWVLSAPLFDSSNHLCADWMNTIKEIGSTISEGATVCP